MNLSYTYKLLAAANEQRHGFLKLQCQQADSEVRLRTEAGLVEATFNDGKKGSFTASNRLTALEHAFLPTFKNHQIPESALLLSEMPPDTSI